MIQRIQTLWLFLAALISGLMMLDWYTGYVYKADIPEGFGSAVKYLTVRSDFPSLVIAMGMTLLPLIAIFLFKDRKKQRAQTLLAMLVSVGFIAINLFRISNFNKNTSPAPANGSYQLGSLLPVLVILFLILALRGINKDEKLVKSMDRLR
ncbi:MAG TPA: DUF4293 domain-containing protein [Flavipsychrobacter sp.]|nr:DUF4293 domain-containing protein [Flavipsychrobacter sp.]